jgi:hypothetical protein
MPDHGARWLWVCLLAAVVAIAVVEVRRVGAEAAEPPLASLTEEQCSVVQLSPAAFARATRITHLPKSFRISRKILWIGMEAYPLQHVTRVEPIKIVPSVSRFVVSQLMWLVFWLGIGTSGFLINNQFSYVPSILGYSFLAVFVLTAAVHELILVIYLRLPPLYALRITTAGVDRVVLINKNRHLVHDLTFRVLDATDNLSAEFEMRMEYLDLPGDTLGGLSDEVTRV